MIQEYTHNFSLYTCLIDNTTQLSYISISSLAAFKMLLILLLHHYSNSHQLGNYPLPVSVCNFKVIVSDGCNEQVPGSSEGGWRKLCTVQDFKYKAVTAGVPGPDGQ